KFGFFLLAPHFLFTSPSPFPKPVFEEPKKNPLASILDSGSCRAPIDDPFLATGSWRQEEEIAIRGSGYFESRCCQ
ncbi:hypothetical protein LINPERHAP1_LOCUS28949, partial [Linum perenne]